MAGQARHVVFVDDEPAVCRAVVNTLEQLGLEIHYFTRAADCLKQLPYLSCDLLITDLRMPEMNGIELLTRVKQIMPSLPVLVLTGYGDIPIAVASIRAGACDFIEKPVSRETLVSAIMSVLERNSNSGASIRKPLTHREIAILQLILNGRSNREMARMLHRSIRTIEFHRSNIMHKLDAHNAVELTERAISLGQGLRG